MERSSPIARHTMALKARCGRHSYATLRQPCPHAKWLRTRSRTPSTENYESLESKPTARDQGQRACPGLAGRGLKVCVGLGNTTHIICPLGTTTTRDECRMHVHGAPANDIVSLPGTHMHLTHVGPPPPTTRLFARYAVGPTRLSHTLTHNIHQHQFALGRAGGSAKETPKRRAQAEETRDRGRGETNKQIGNWKFPRP